MLASSRRKTLPSLLLACLVAGIMSTSWQPATAGECTWPDSSYVACLEKYSPGEQWSYGEWEYCFRCLQFGRGVGGAHWAGPLAVDYFRSLRESRYRDRVEAACTRILCDRAKSGSLTDGFASAATGILAVYGIAEAGGYDIYSLLFQQPDQGRLLVSLAGLGDPRSVPWIAARYDSLRALGLEPPANRWALEATLSCLYHIPGREAVALAQAIETKETDAGLRQRAHRVVNRPGSATAR